MSEQCLGTHRHRHRQTQMLADAGCKLIFNSARHTQPPSSAQFSCPFVCSTSNMLVMSIGSSTPNLVCLSSFLPPVNKCAPVCTVCPSTTAAATTTRRSVHRSACKSSSANCLPACLPACLCLIGTGQLREREGNRTTINATWQSGKREEEKSGHRWFDRATDQLAGCGDIDYSKCCCCCC